MKKLLLLVSAVVLAVGLAGCKPGVDVPGLTEIVLSGIADAEVTVGDSFNALTGVTAMGDDDVDYSAEVTVDSETCVIAADGTVDTSTAKICVLNYTVVVEGKFVRGSMTLTIKPEEIIIVDAPLLMGWDFEDASDLEGWAIYTANGGSIDMSIEDGAMKLVTTSGGARYETRLDYMGVPLEEGYDYKVSFKMKSDIDGKKVHLNFGELLPAAPWFTPFKAEGIDIITLTTEWVEYSYTFNMALDNQNGGPLFEMGNMDGSTGLDATIWIDDLKIEGGSGSDTVGPAITGVDNVIIELGDAFDALAGVAALDFVDGDLTSAIVLSGDTVDVNTAGVYTLTYTVEDAAGNETVATRTVTVVGFVLDVNNSAVSDAFDTDMVIGADESAAWYTTITWGQPIFTAEFVGGQLVMSGAKDGDKDYGTDYWNHIVRFTEMKFIEGVEYKIVFDAMTDEVDNTTNNIMFKVEAGSFGAETQMLVPNTMGTLEFVFTWNAPTTTEGSLLFFVGGREQVITVENLMVYISAEGANVVNAPVLMGAEDQIIKPGEALDLDTLVTAVDLEDGAIVPTYTVAGPADQTVFDSNVEGVWTITYTATDLDGNETTAVVLVSVVALVFEATDMIENGSFDSSGWYTWVDVWNYNGSGAAEAYLNVVNADVDAEMELDIVAAGGAGWAIQMTQDLTLEVGQDYQVSFDAYATAARNINAVTGYSDGSNTWQQFGGTADLAITDTKTTYTYILAATDPGDFQVQLKFEAGGDANNVYIDNVKVEKWDGTAVVADTDVAVNGDMSLGDNLEGWTSWSRDWAPIITSSLVEQWNELVFHYDGVGDATWNNQISYEGLTFEHGATYRLVFKAKGDAARDFKVNIYDGTNGLESEDFALTTEFQTYEHVFTYNLGATAKVEFQLGAFTTSDGSVFYLDDVVIEKLVQDEVVMNGEFNESGWTSFVDYWFWSGAASEVYFNLVNGEMELDVVQPGGAGWAIQLIQNVTLEAGQQYMVTFDAYAVADRTINAVTGYQRSSDNSWQEFGGLSGQAITTTKTTYSYVLTAQDPGTDQAQLKFEVGGDATNVYIDNVKLEKYDGTAVVADTDMAVNGTFDQPVDWYNWIDPEGWSGAATEAYITVVDGVVVIDIVQAGGQGWAIQFVQDIELKEGLTYIVEFDAYAVAGRTINAVVGFDNGSWNLMGGNEAMAITDTLATYSFSFVATDPGDAQVVLKLEVGGDLNNVYIDNVIIYPDYN